MQSFSREFLVRARLQDKMACSCLPERGKGQRGLCSPLKGPHRCSLGEVLQASLLGIELFCLWQHAVVVTGTSQEQAFSLGKNNSRATKDWSCPLCRKAAAQTNEFFVSFSLTSSQSPHQKPTLLFVKHSKYKTTQGQFMAPHTNYLPFSPFKNKHLLSNFYVQALWTHSWMRDWS